MEARFACITDPNPIDMDEGGGEILVDTTNYISPQKQIEAMLNAGMRLMAIREEQYDDIKGTDDLVPDPTRAPGFDLADASQLAAGANLRIRKSREDFITAEKAKAKEAEKAASEKTEEK